jgi:prophage tail gpP-like protein
MSKPIAGQQYTVQANDTIERIASIAYGDSRRSRDILNANQTDIIIPGLVLNLPPENKTTSLISSDGLVLLLGGLEILTESLRFFESIETIADGWTGVIAWTPGEKPELDKIIRPYSYASAQIFLDRELLGTGRLYVTSPILESRQECILECWSLTADFVDSALKPPYEENEITLKQRAETLAQAFSLKVIVDLEQDGIFDRVTAEPSQTAGAHLLSLAKQRGVLISSTAKGELFLSIPQTTGKPVATIEEGVEGFTGFQASYDGRARFSDYRVIGETPFDEPNNAVSKDKGVSVTRFKTKTVGETTQGEMKTAAGFEKTKFLANALTLPISVRGFKRENGNRWKKGEYVTLISPTLFIKKGFLMLIKSVEFSIDDNGEVTQLTLVPPSVYSGQDIEEPWL